MAKDHQRGEPLRGRRGVVEGGGSERDAQRVGQSRAVLREILSRHRAADSLEIGGELVADIAAIEIVEPGLAEMFERGGEGGLLELRARLRRFAVEQKGLHEAGRGFQFGVFLNRQPRLAARHAVAFARAFNGGLKQHMQRQLGARAFAGLRLGGLAREHPPCHRARHGERGERPARRNGFVVERLPHNNRSGNNPLAEALQDNTQTPVPDQVSFRLDFPAWLATRTERDRKVILDLMSGERTLAVAARYGLSPARVSQLRLEFCSDWKRFTESTPAAA